MSKENIGDITSAAIGSGARFNAGKPAVELLPISEVARYYHILEGGTDQAPGPLVHALYKLGQFQEGGDEGALFDIIHILGSTDAILESAHVFGYGAKKYAAHNWIKGMPWSVPLACAVRHLLAMLDRELIDPESGRAHRGHIICNVWMLILYTRTYRQGDDRPPRELFGLIGITCGSVHGEA